MSSSLARLLKQAESYLGAGNAPAAQLACEQALRKAARNPDALFLLGVALLSQGRAGEALPLFERLLAIEPRHGAGLEYLGLTHLMRSDFAAAEQALAQAARIAGAPASVHMRLGIAKLEQGRAEEAVASLRRALTLAPHDADCHVNLGRALAALGDTAGAERGFRKALALAPDRAEPAFNLGVLDLGRDDLAQAKAWFERAITLSPQSADARVNLAVVLRRQGELVQAEAELRRARALAPHDAAVLTELARILALRAQPDSAREHYSEAIRANPRFAAAHEGLAALCIGLGRIAEAIAHLRAALEVEPDNVPAAAALANSLFEAGNVAEGFEIVKRVLAREPGHAAGYATLANIHLIRGELQDAIQVLDAGYRQTKASALLANLTYQLRQACDWPKWRAAWNHMQSLLDTDADLSSPFWLLCEPTSAAEQLRYARRWSASRFRNIAPLDSVCPLTHADRRIRIGYLSADFHEHATAYLIAQVLEQHDRDRFEIFAYSYGPDDKSPTRERLRAACEHFVDFARDPDDVAARRICADGLDVLIDLKGYTLGDRLGIMAHRPCRIQATWLGYPGTTGASFMDYAIADPVVIPEGEEANYSERILRLPHCYQPNDRIRHVADPLRRGEYCLPEGGFVFACFNQAYKITPEIFAVWMRVLQATPASVLWLLESNPLAKANLVHSAQQHGIESHRLIFGPRLRNAEHLARYRVADLALDTFPYTSHTTMSDALWCGCAAIALCGDTFAARVSTSLLMAIGMPELVTHSIAEYEELATALARDRERLEELRGRIRRARDEAPLFDSRRFTRELETLYADLVCQRHS